ncbi:MAG: hypothetical protein K6E64_04370 [Lachnospiraceae bacterium]|nr:hypothetical protein [Lachnospiraceae bacterium]
MKKRILFFLLMSLCVLGSLTACGSSKDKTTQETVTEKSDSNTSDSGSSTNDPYKDPYKQN